MVWLHTPVLSRLSTPLPGEFGSQAESRSIYNSTLLAQAATNRPRVSVSAPAIAKQVSVRIITNSGMGSGVIIQRQGQTYKILTCAHVVADSQDNYYTILTADGRMYTGKLLHSPQSPDADLAIVQFTSQQAYRVVAIADSKALKIGDSIYTAGFPNWQWTNSNAVEETRNWGTKAFRFTTGKVAMLPEKSLKKGYQLGYTNEILQGMSGGPVLNKYGQLIGINGRMKYPAQGIDSFIFADGTLPSKELRQQMEGLSWAVPSTAFWQALK